MSLRVLKTVKESSDKCEIMIMGFEGWPDAGRAASTSLGYIVHKYGIDVYIE